MPPTPPHPHPGWDGIPLDELPIRLLRGLDLIVILEHRGGFPAGDVLSDNLNRGAVSSIRGADITVNDRGGTTVTLWLPAFEDQKTDTAEQADTEEGELADHILLPESERWLIAEVAFAALGAAMPRRVVHFGFLTSGTSLALPWHDYCHRHPHPPEFAIGYWEYEDD